MDDRKADSLAALRAGWWAVPVVVAAALGGAALFGSEQEPLYRADATLAVVPHPSIESHSDVLRTIDVLDRRTMVATLARLPSASRVRDLAEAEISGDRDDIGAYRVDASVVPNTYLIRLTVRGPSPERAARLANALVRASAGEAAGYYPAFALRPLDAADAPAGPTGREEERPFLVAAILGLFLGLLAAYAIGLARRA